MGDLFRLGEEVNYKLTENQRYSKGIIVSMNGNLIELKVGNGFIVLEKNNISKAN